MTLIDENEVYERQEKQKRIFNLIVTTIILLVILLVVIVVFSMVSSKGAFVFKVNDTVIENVEDDIVLRDKKKIYEEDGEVYFSVQKLANLLQYQFYNGEYKNKGESSEKCQVQCGNEYTSYIVGSNKVYKAVLREGYEDYFNLYNFKNISQEGNLENLETSTTYEYFTINKPIKLVNDTIYASKEAIELGFNLSISVDVKNNTVSIYTLDGLEIYASKVRSKDMVSSYNYCADSKRLLKYGLTVVKDSSGNFGIGSYSDSNKLDSFVVSCKYSKLSFNEGTRTIEAYTSIDNRKCVLYLDLEKQEVVDTMYSQYDDIKQIDNEFKYFIVRDNDKFGIINRNGKNVLMPRFDEIGFDDGLYLDVENGYIIDNKYIPVKEEGKWGLYGIEGNLVLESQFDGIGCSLCQSGESVLVVPELNGTDAIVVKYNQNMYALYSVKGPNKIAVSLIEVFKKYEDGNVNYYMNHLISKENGIIHTLNIYKDL